MRLKDDTKRVAIFNATIQLLNKIGFNNISMSKIAKEANVSASTLYVYFDNKEDMLQKVYLEAKQQMFMVISKDLREDRSVEENIFQLCKNILDFSKEYREYLLVFDQLSFAPIMANTPQEDTQKMLEFIFSIMRRGISQGILKDVQPDLLLAYCYYPILQICKEQWSYRGNFTDIDDAVIQKMCWDAIKA